MGHDGFRLLRDSVPGLSPEGQTGVSHSHSLGTEFTSQSRLQAFRRLFLAQKIGTKIKLR